MFNSLKVLTLCLLPLLGVAQPSVVVDAYIKQAIESNETLKQQDYKYQKAISSLAEAKKLFLPDASFGVTYTLAAGGRKIDFPIGDLLNPVYATLNQITMSNNFPTLENQEVSLLPNNFYDARVRITAPIWSTELQYLKLIRTKQTEIPQLEAEVFRRELIKDVRIAYLNYLQATEVIAIYDQGLALLAEGKRVTESLLRNDMAIPSQILRIEGDIAEVTSQKIDAQGNALKAAAYLNFLCNQPLNTPIQIDSSLVVLPQMPDAFTTASRAELKQLDAGMGILKLLTEMQRKFYRPTIGAQLDLGSQAFNFRWGGYGLLGLSAEIPLWDNKRHSLRAQQAEIDEKILTSQRLQVVQQLDLQANLAHQTLKTKLEQYNLFPPQLESVNRGYRDVLRRYKEGQANYIELLDARSQVTNVLLRQSLARTQAWVAFVELERAISN